ncbi:MAG: DUF4336 domain-containing protein [Oscillatoriophycideae cyanobacterium NC_groundwater_1537_Pr4_S-0.65um_50_18]|nr:DUF4336 domain-containing protein [Oscillatoriophycideae cyanobacterium NC_groundwater_1537_Pr4_S-0.65um_50_18]
MDQSLHQIATQQPSSDWAWRFWYAVPLYPYGKRRTLRTEVVKDTIWTFEQVQGILYVVVPIRMTIVKLETGGLLVYAPIAPTRECLRLVNEIAAQHGAVKYIILPTVSGIEHKVFVGPFARNFPAAQIFVAPDQWSFPLNLPLSWLGLPAKRTHVLPPDSSKTPFGNEFDYAILGPIQLGLGPFEEAAFFHRRSRTLLVTDTILSVPLEPPAIVQLDPKPLLFHAKDHVFDTVEDTPENRRKGWQRIALFAFYFRPSAIKITEIRQSFRDARQAPDRSKSNYFGWFPFEWRTDWQRSFQALQGNGRLFVAPILQALILNRSPQATIDWANRVSSWNFQRIIPCHLDSPLQTDPHQFRQAFAFLEKNSSAALLPEADFQLLRELEAGLIRRGITPPAAEKIERS